MERKYEVYYEEHYDRLMIAGKDKSDVMAGSIRILNVILDFNTENKIVNAELLDVSEYLESLGLDPKILKRIKSGKLSFKQLRNGYEIIFVLEVDKNIVPIPYNIHLPSKKQIAFTS